MSPYLLIFIFFNSFSLVYITKMSLSHTKRTCLYETNENILVFDFRIDRQRIHVVCPLSIQAYHCIELICRFFIQFFCQHVIVCLERGKQFYSSTFDSSAFSTTINDQLVSNCSRYSTGYRFNWNCIWKKNVFFFLNWYLTNKIVCF